MLLAGLEVHIEKNCDRCLENVARGHCLSLYGERGTGNGERAGRGVAGGEEQGAGRGTRGTGRGARGAGSNEWEIEMGNDELEIEMEN